jgi:chorismate mutase
VPGREIPVPGSLPHVIRVLIHYYAAEDHEPRHVYLREAATLREDLQAAQ